MQQPLAPLVTAFSAGVRHSGAGMARPMRGLWAQPMGPCVAHVAGAGVRCARPMALCCQSGVVPLWLWCPCG
ncbi:hypothetical protein [Acetobacter syzygii]|uniref:hypothetical protein n=1 Tax=Acetobacter syzygii TaxID=146476 RepID=UPI001178743F|nr:hypothetical protein [Acetobacter syzygii]